MDTLIKVPSHVSPAVVFDFDFYHDQSYGEYLHESLQHLHRDAPDVFYTPANGGHWVVTRYEQIAQIVQDPEHFSVREMQIPRVANPPRFLPLSLDPPECQPYRGALLPIFAPKGIKDLEPKVRYWAKKIVADVADRGSCDFVRDVAELFPVSIFMELMGMDLSRLREFRATAEHFFSVQNDAAELHKTFGEISGIMTGYIEQKQRQPDQGLISHLIGTQINGRPMRLDELQNMCILLFLGGMHTVTNVAGFTYWQLAAMPELQQRLAEHPELIPNFVEEGLRMFGVIFTPRIVRQDTERFGVSFRTGDMVLCMLPLAGRDERVNPDPTRFDIDRPHREYLTFSKGPHLCIGHFLARTEIRILTEEWLARVPRFAIAAGARQRYSTSTGLGISNLPLVWQK